MKIFDINGHLVNVSVCPSDYPLRYGISKLQDLVRDKLTAHYIHETVLEEFGIPGSRLRLDFYLPKLNLAIEVMSSLHQHHSDFHHGSKLNSTFHKSVKNDISKNKWLSINGIELIEIWSEEDFNKLYR